MSSQRNRVNRLEGAFEGRCGTCRDWKDAHLGIGREGTDPFAGLPDRCPDCGFEPVQVVFVFSREAGRL